MDREQVIALQHQRFATIGLEPWKMLLLKNERMKEDLKPIAWGALSSLEGASHFVIYLARKGVTYDSDYVKKVMHEVKKRDYDTDSRFAQMIKNFQESDMKLNSERSLFDWASKQTYIQMANMMAAAMLGIDSCPIEGYDQEKVEAYLKEKGYLNTAEFGVSVMASFGYRNQEITPKTRWNTEVIYEVIE
ncbi:NAD(P)H-dependent flavin oxidoreductase FrxA [Helicobacter pylori]|nr:NAD(P)H-dependent oxidoreductase [Helicobacter pylori]